MGFRFRRSIRLFPGVTLNLSRSGVSTSIGVKGARVTLGKNGVRETISAPGTGLSYTHLDRSATTPRGAAEPRQSDAGGLPDEPPQALTRHGAGYWIFVALLAAFIVWLIHLAYVSPR